MTAECRSTGLSTLLESRCRVSKKLTTRRFIAAYKRRPEVHTKTIDQQYTRVIRREC